VATQLALARQRHVRAMLAAARRCDSLADWLPTTLEALERRLGYARSSVLLVLNAPRPSIARAFAGAARGWDTDVLAKYFEHWADCDPLASDPARAMFESHGFASTATLYPQLDPERRRFVDEFLKTIDVGDQLSLRLAGNITTDGYLTIHAPSVISDADTATLLALAAGLAAQLRTYLPRGLAVALTERAQQVAELVALGFTNREIAAILNLGEDTVKKHLYRAMTKLGLRHRTQLAVSWTTGRILVLPATQAARR
jgi:DNA-binding CsgD family transcriptional regulator